MVPLYSLGNLLSTKFFQYSTYFILLFSTYAAVAIASYFTLLCHYLAPDGDFKQLFSNVQPGPWQNYFPLPIAWLRDQCGGEKGFLRTLNSGLTWFNVCASDPILDESCWYQSLQIIQLGVFQYCLVRSLTSIASVVAQPFGRYCGASLSPIYCHIWVYIVQRIFVSNLTLRIDPDTECDICNHCNVLLGPIHMADERCITTPPSDTEAVVCQNRLCRFDVSKCESLNPYLPWLRNFPFWLIEL